MNILEVEGLCKTYPAFRLRDVSFAVAPGTIMGFIGRNGAGRAFLLAVIPMTVLMVLVEALSHFQVVGPYLDATDAAGQVRQLPVLAVGLAAFALPYLPARRAAAQPAGLQDTNKPLGVCMALTGAALLASGVAAGNTARYAILYPEVLSGSYPVWAAWADLLLPVFAGAWLLNYAVRAFSGFGRQRQRLGSSLLAGAVPLVFLWRLIWRFQFAPASLYRMPCTLRVLSAAAALLLAVVLIKIFLVPGLPCGHTLYAAGTGAFLLCTGLVCVLIGLIRRKGDRI